MPALDPLKSRPRALRALALSILAIGASACSDESGPVAPPPTTRPGGPARPEIVSPADGARVETDSPTLVVRNAAGFDAGQAEYTFQVTSASGAREIYAATVPAGTTETRHVVTDALPRGMLLAWSVVASSAAGQVSSSVARFRGPQVDCLPTGDAYAKSVVDWFIPECSLAQNIYNDPAQVIGPPDSRGTGPDMFTGFVSLGEGGWVSVDMEVCAADLAGADVRVFQRASSEPVTLYAAGTPEGPFFLLEARKPCGAPSVGTRSGHCTFDLAAAEIEIARYFRIEDGELYPCPGDTVSEGADIDAIEILNFAP